MPQNLVKIPPLKALGNNVVIQPLELKERSRGGIVLVQNRNEVVIEGTVVGVGKGIQLENGSYSEIEVKVGDVALYEPRVGKKVEYEGVEYLIIPAEGVLAKRI